MKKCILFLAACSMVVFSEAWAADKEGNFAAKGAGRKSCGDFVSSAEQKNSDFLLYGGWVEGYFSAYNQFQTNNYDISPWQTTELMMIFLQRHCKSNPEAKFLDAANSLIRAFHPIRLTDKKGIVEVKVGDSKSYYYDEILLRAKSRLKELGFYQGEVDGSTYNGDDTKAFSAYQQKYKLNVTGIPDQRTLSSLFLKVTK